MNQVHKRKRVLIRGPTTREVHDHVQLCG